MMPERALLMAGPTASGKSKIALNLAARLGSVIINADSMQVYRDLQELTARPDKSQEKSVPHRLYGFVDAATPYSVGRWNEDLESALEEAEHLSLFPIITGGTGLYFKAALEGLAEIPAIPEAVRVETRNQLDAEGAVALYVLLEREDPLMAARLAPRDGQRIARALEVVRATGRSLASWQGESGKGALKEMDAAGLIIKIMLVLPRDALYARIDRRFDHMMKGDALQEVQSLLDRGLQPDLPAMRALGVPQLAAFIRGEINLEEAVEKAKTESRRFAKRQLTWFENQFADWQRIDPGRRGAVEEILKIVRGA